MDVQNKEAVLVPEGTPSATAHDLEKQDSHPPVDIHSSAFKSLGVLDRFLALWIFLAMLIGILLGNFVDSTGPALQRGEFVGVSIPIGMAHCRCEYMLARNEANAGHSNRTTSNDVSHPLQSQVRDFTSFFSTKDLVGASWV